MIYLFYEMQCVNKSVLVPYADGEMFELVDRVESYPQFIIITLRSGPFRRLHGEWRFRALVDAFVRRANAVYGSRH